MNDQQQRSPNVSTGIEAPSLVALTLVALKLGLRLDARRLMRDNSISGIDVDPASLIRCAASAGLRATGLRPGWDGLAGLAKALPAIVYLRDGGAMVLLRVEQGDGTRAVAFRADSAGVAPGLEL